MYKKELSDDKINSIINSFMDGLLDGGVKKAAYEFGKKVAQNAPSWLRMIINKIKSVLSKAKNFIRKLFSKKEEIDKAKEERKANNIIYSTSNENANESEYVDNIINFSDWTQKCRGYARYYSIVQPSLT